MVENLVRNAIRFSEAGDSVEIKVALDGPDVAVVVRDHGPGIPAEQLDRVFDRFYTVPRALQTERGAGLGLAISKGVAELHRGSIGAAEPPGGGCELVVHLPLSTTST